jgi:hypothetical protein
MEHTTTTQEPAMPATAKQISYIESLVRSAGFFPVQSTLETYAANGTVRQHTAGLSKSSWAKWLGRSIDRDQASRLIDELLGL